MKNKTTIAISLDPSIGIDMMDYLEELNGFDNIMVHLDIMDGKFVAREAVTIDEYTHVVQNSRHKIDVHLMVAKPSEVVNIYLAKAIWGSINSLSFHVEPFEKEADAAVSILKKIKVMGIQAGVVVDLNTRVEDVQQELLKNSDVITIMSVKCGASGQSFNPSALQKIIWIRKNHPHLRIIVDGGINARNINTVMEAGADTAVVGSALYSAGDRAGELLVFSKNTEKRS